MGQETGKSAWPKPAGGYQTISGRRYGRRHAYISFRPVTDKRRATSTVDCQSMKRTSSHKDHAVASKGNISSVLQTIIPVAPSNSLRPGLNATSNRHGHSRKQSLLYKALKAPANHLKRPKSDQVVPYDSNYHSDIDRNNQARVWPQHEETKTQTSPEVLSYINIDAYEPDSSDADEEDLSSNPSQAAQEKRLDGLICKLGVNVDSLEDSEHSPEVAPSKTSTELGCAEPDSHRTVKANRKVGQLLVGEDHVPKCQGVTASAGPVSFKNVGNTDPEEIFQSEMVVRPKIRKQTSETRLERRKRPEKEEKGHLSGSVVKCDSAPPGFLAQTSREREFPFDFPPLTLNDLNPLQRTREDSCNTTKYDDDDEIWEDLKNFGEKKVDISEKSHESSSEECSEGEWSASWTSDSGLEKERCTSEESWETLHGMDELPGCSSSSSSLEEVPSLNLALEEQTPLEEGEIPWLMYNEDSGSSSDEDPDGVSQFVHPGLFILDGNNNLEDDSSMSEDLDTEWRFLDEFNEGFGMAQAISYVDHSQLLTYMALEERLAQAMEAALAHLESLAVDVEQAHPPATEQIINCLPQITVQADNTEQEQCCAICCSEYVNDEIATLLPCRHMFHKLCVTLWLRKSGTCPVCRHVLTSAETESPSLNSEQDTSPSNHSAPGGTC
ncbi:E3 ubiquitin-protein ligase Praja-2-like isoform X1 [Xyrauchen texanus]|uniref:E3 ubiquitin-protein ligase Praja-2-like isoform X1 n=1 Tax=Xyrauchen texanus TaxID=154827 RepID=UPI002241FCF5|nr:E3 ubiquitin-protein ligase Praja-2-like isoform X1 [Xyrauchen texanus]XP_051981777.1 E3 ubiquitin-protein ligase Praja-2-like isoform X1 [Xyrauchen texanus]